MDDITREFHKAVEDNNFPLVKYCLSHPHLPVKADIHASDRYGNTVWKFIHAASPEIQDYLLSFDYIENDEERIIAQKTAYENLYKSKSVDAFKKLLQLYPDVATNEELNQALMHNIKQDNKDLCIALLNHHPNTFEPIWYNGAAMVNVLLYHHAGYHPHLFNVELLINHTPYEFATHRKEELTKIIHYNRDTIKDAIHYMLIDCPGTIDINQTSLFINIFKYIGESEDIYLLDYFMQPNRYNNGLDMFWKSAILIEIAFEKQFECVIKHFIKEYGLRLHQLFGDRDPIECVSSGLHELTKELQEYESKIELHDMLQNTLPITTKKVHKNKI